MDIKSLHQWALRAASNWKSAERELIEVLQIINKKKAYRKLGYPTLFSYAENALKLPAEHVYRFNAVAKKCTEVPELKVALLDGTLNVSRARRIASVINKENHEEWIRKAATLPQRKLEMEVAAVNPKVLTPERIKPVSRDRSLVSTGVSHATAEGLERLKDLLSQKLKKPCGLEEVLNYLVSDGLKRLDPIQKAKRNTKKPLKLSSRIKRRLPAQVAHQVTLRDQTQCTQKNPDGSRCKQRRWLEIHHLVPFSLGGSHRLDNLATLCQGHHRAVHGVNPANPTATRTTALKSPTIL